MAHDGEEVFRHGDSIPCVDEGEGECVKVTHEPISVTGPEDADDPVVEPRFAEDLGKPTEADYRYRQQLELDGEECETEVCIPDGKFQVKGQPLRVGFLAEKSDGSGPAPARWSFIGRIRVGGRETYTAPIISVPGVASARLDMDQFW